MRTDRMRTDRMRTDRKVYLMTVSGILAALIVLFTAFIFHIPVGVHGGYIHFGDAVIYLAASLLPQPYALLTAAIGGGLSDLLTAPMWAPATIVIKVLLTLPFTAMRDTIWNKRNGLAVLAASGITVFGYVIAEAILFSSFATAFVSISGNIIQAAGSGAAFAVLAKMLDRTGFKKKVRKINV